MSTVFHRLRQGRLQPPGHVQHGPRGHLAHLPVVGIQAVVLPLHIAELGIDAAAQALGDGGQHHAVVQPLDPARQLPRGVGLPAVAVAFPVPGRVALHPEGDAAALAEEQEFPRPRPLQHPAAEVDVLALHVPLLLGKPAGRADKEPGGIRPLQQAADPVGVVLAPALVENRPAHNAGVVLQMGHGVQAVAFEEGLALLAPAAPQIAPPPAHKVRDHRVPQVAVPAGVHHVLEHQHTQTVAGVVERLRLDLHVLAQGVEAQLLHAQDVPLVLLRLRREEQAILKIALIQHPVEKDRLSVQAQAGSAADLPGGHGAQGEIALHPVGFGGGGELVQVGVLRAPQVGVGKLQPDGPLHPPGGDVPPLPQGDADGELRPARLHLHVDPGEIRRDPQGGHRPPLRHGLQPHSLPDAGHRGVPHTMGAFMLLAVGVVPGEGVHRLHLQPVFPGEEGGGDIGGKGQVAPLVADDAFAVHPRLRHLVHRPEVEQHPEARGGKALRQGEGGFVPQYVSHLPRPAGQGGLGWPGNPDGPAVQRPALAQGEEAVPPELRAGVSPVPAVVRHTDLPFCGAAATASRGVSPFFLIIPPGGPGRKSGPPFSSGFPPPPDRTTPRPGYPGAGRSSSSLHVAAQKPGHRLGQLQLHVSQGGGLPVADEGHAAQHVPLGQDGHGDEDAVLLVSVAQGHGLIRLDAPALLHHLLQLGGDPLVHHLPAGDAPGGNDAVPVGDDGGQARHPADGVAELGGEVGHVA